MNVQDGLNVALNNLSKNSIVPLNEWGSYNTVGTKITLSDSMANYRFLLIRYGADAGAGTAGGPIFIPVPLYSEGTYDAPAQIQCFGVIGNNITHCGLIKNSDTELEIITVKNFTTGSTSIGSGIRRVFGIK